MNNRVVYFDILRGLAILGVIIIHTSASGLQFPSDSLNFNFTIIWRQLWNFSVPLFLAISGYFLVKKSIKNTEEYIQFLKKQIPKIYIPMLFWSVLWLLVGIFILNESFLKELIKLFIFQSSGPYYFIALILQYYILLPYLKKGANSKGLFISIIISTIILFIIYYFRYFTDIKLYTIIYAGNSLTWIVFFTLGLYLGAGKRILLSNKLLIILIIVFFLLSCIETFILDFRFNNIGYAITAVKFSSFIYSFLLIVYLFQNINLMKSKLLQKAGEKSFGIYLIHMFLIPIYYIILNEFFENLLNIQPIYQFIIIISTLLLSYILIISLNKYLKNKLIIKIMGF